MKWHRLKISNEKTNWSWNGNKVFYTQIFFTCKCENVLQSYGQWTQQKQKKNNNVEEINWNDIA